MTIPAFVTGIVSAISAHVVAVRAAKGLPPLVDGKILLGRQRVLEASAPPRVVFVPVDGQAVLGVNELTFSDRTVALAQALVEPLGVIRYTFEVHVWGQASPPDPDADFDASVELAIQVMRTCQLAAGGSVQASRLGPMFPDQSVTATQLVKAGHEVVFGLTFSQPILSETLGYAPEETTVNPTVTLTTPGGGSPEAS